MSLKAAAAGVNSLFFMASVDYSLGKYIEISQEVKADLKPETVMIANIGDYGPPAGKRLKEVRKCWEHANRS